MLRLGMRHAAAGFAALDLLLGVLLLQHAWENSWFLWSPPDSNVWYVEFRPYVTFYPGLMFEVLGAVTIAGLALGSGRGHARPEAWFTAVVWTHFLLGTGMILATVAIFSFLLTCYDPGGCVTEFKPYPPVAIPSLILFAEGACGVLLDLRSRRQGAHTLPPALVEP